MPEFDAEFDAGDRERDSRYTTVAIVLAVVFLTVLGAGVGLLLGLGRDGGDGGDGGSTVADQSPAPSVTASDDSGGDDGEPASAQPNSSKTRPASPTRSYPPPDRNSCPRHSVDAARTDLTLVLYIRTARSEAWICQGQGRTFYQGHVLGRPFPAATSDHTIFLSDVRYEAGVHAATNGNTVYYVSTERLRIEKNGQEIENEPVVDSNGG